MILPGDLSTACWPGSQQRTPRFPVTQHQSGPRVRLSVRKAAWSSTTSPTSTGNRGTWDDDDLFPLPSHKGAAAFHGAKAKASFAKGGIPRISIPTVTCRLFAVLPAVPNTNRGLIENMFLSESRTLGPVLVMRNRNPRTPGRTWNTLFRSAGFGGPTGQFFFSMCPPNSKRMADNNLSPKSASPRELKRS
jgi:hypothetical protein